MVGDIQGLGKIRYVLNSLLLESVDDVPQILLCHRYLKVANSHQIRIQHFKTPFCSNSGLTRPGGTFAERL